MRPRWIWLVGLVLVTVISIASYGGYRASQERRFKADLGEARRHLAEGRPALARSQLKTLLALRPNDGEVAYHLGLAEEKGGNASAAIAAWEGVPGSSPFFLKAAIGRGRLALEAGRFGEAEALLEGLLPPSGPIDSELLPVLELVYRYEGRTRDVRRLIVRSWEAAVDPVRVIRRLYLLDHSAYPIGMVRKIVERADPADDRVWLAKANLERAAGHFDEAAHWLDQCRKKHPSDPVVTLAALDLAIASDDSQAALEAASRLPAEAISLVELRRLRCWFAARGDDRETEKRALEHLLTFDPGDIASYDRLAELAALRGSDQESSDWTRRRKESNDRRERYKALITRDDRAKSAGELATLASALGREAEAEGWRKVAEGSEIQGPLIRGDLEAGPTVMLIQQLADLHPPSGGWPQGANRAETTPTFLDDSQSAGLTFVYNNGHIGRRNPPPPEAMGGGVALLDYDSDGLLDVYLVQGGPFPFVDPSADDGDRLFRNMGDGHFERRHRAFRDRAVSQRLWQRRDRRRLRQRRPSRPVRHPLAELRPLPEQGRRHV